MKSKTKKPIASALCLGFLTFLNTSNLTKAELIGHDLDGNADTVEIYYDTELRISWLKDTNLAESNTFGVEGIRDDGGMSWHTAHEWIEAMNNAEYLGISDWRLPNDFPRDPSFGLANNPDNEGYFLEFSTTGISDGGFALQGDGWIDTNGTPATELGHMFYVTLNNLPSCIPDFVTPVGDDLRCLNDVDDRNSWPPASGLTNTGPFTNLEAKYYWATQEDPRDGGQRGRGLNFTTGFRISLGKTISRNRAWPVVSGAVGTSLEVTPTLLGIPVFVEELGQRKIILTLEGNTEELRLEYSATLEPDSWIPVDAISNGNTLTFDAPDAEQGFWRIQK